MQGMAMFVLCVLSHFSHVRLFATLWTIAHKAPLSMGFSRQEYGSGLPCPPPGDLPDPGIIRDGLILHMGKWLCPFCVLSPLILIPVLISPIFKMRKLRLRMKGLEPELQATTWCFF